ncbi:hypothetical protein [Pimelobacter sp. 30-1]|uniref:hypothetical protein n=1 Tax=Pimelobacter sp. 30-1 TaxID=2004991 RepID=UPI001C058E86|nr:hypothetical protein [Pimelobacter sp. 30-1]MBU2698572.1 hypothetical protein [Pimelobacter sp. 30-1]
MANPAGNGGEPRAGRPGAHVFVDETKNRDYLMAAAAVLPGDVVDARRQLRGLLLPGAERVHFTHERPSRRRELLNAMRELDVQVTLYVARTRDHAAGRGSCMKAILDDVLKARAQMLVFELDESVAQADRRTIADRFRHEESPPLYRHLRAKEEPLLWISDAVAWCAQRGGEWLGLCDPLLVGRREL